MPKDDLFGPKRRKDDDFWDRYESEIGEFDDDYNDGDWEEDIEEDF